MSRTDTAEHLFRSNPNQWLYWTEFANRCGRLAWRTRISECRKRGLTIENRLDRAADGTVHSYYRYKESPDGNQTVQLLQAFGQSGPDARDSGHPESLL